METHTIAKLLEIAAKDEEQNVIALKRALKENDYKLCFISAEIMLSQMEDRGMNEVQRFYWSALAAAHLPYAPSEALVE